jgi:hypothetical protein
VGLQAVLRQRLPFGSGLRLTDRSIPADFKPTLWEANASSAAMFSIAWRSCSAARPVKSSSIHDSASEEPANQRLQQTRQLLPGRVPGLLGGLLSLNSAC